MAIETSAARLNPPERLTKRFTFTLAGGETITGPVKGAGGFINTLARLNAAARMAAQGRETGMYEPKPGHVAVYPDFCAWSDGRAVTVSLLTSTWTVAS
jgi:hypothetical protein